jgi:dynein heavy chain 1, cytosolic
MLTLRSGERLGVSPNIRIILEVDSLEYATPATVSRCGMVFFNENTVSPKMCLNHLMSSLETYETTGGGETPVAQLLFVQSVRPLVLPDRSSSHVLDALEFSMAEDHIMVTGRDRFLFTQGAAVTRNRPSYCV